jgi:hypothetical protein
MAKATVKAVPPIAQTAINQSGFFQENCIGMKKIMDAANSISVRRLPCELSMKSEMNLANHLFTTSHYIIRA